MQPSRSHRTSQQVTLPMVQPAKDDRFEDRAALLEAIVSSSEDGILTKDLNGIITSWNPAATRIFGYLPEEMIGQSILRIIPPDLQTEETEILRKLRAGQRIEHFETTRLAKSGEPVFVSLTISPLKDNHGKVVGASKIVRDISVHRQLEALRIQLASIVESSDDAILSKNLDGIITSWNTAAARLFGYTEEEIVGSSILRLIPEHLHGEEREILARLRQGQRIDHFETVRLKKNGDLVQVSLTISPVRDRTGTIIGASKILHDISARKRMESSLLQAEKIAATGRMAATIAHEINNPLEGLLNLIYLARTSLSDQQQALAYLTAAEGELGRLAHIAKQTLGFYREEASPVSISLAKLIQNALTIYEPRLQHNDIALRSNLPELPAIMVKRGEIMQVVSNLIVNSILAMPRGGVLTINLRAVAPPGKPDGIMLEINDTGTGISPENLGKIFDPFFTTRGEIGTGIGLWVAQQFIEGHLGSISASSSTHPDSHGTKMSVYLPFQNSYSSSAT
jgi:PAS domain S-box-containing protein